MVPMLLGIAVQGLATTMTNPALPAIAADLGMSPRARLWVIDVVPLALAAGLVAAARAGDQWGRRRVLACGLIGYAVCGLIGAAATTPWVLIAARTVTGCAAAAVLASVVASIGAIYAAHERVLAYGMWTGTFGAAAGFGPIVGGLLGTGSGWRIGMAACAVVAVLAAALTFRLLPDSRATAVHWDLPSLGLSVAGLAGCVTAMQELPDNLLLAAGLGFVGVGSLLGFIMRQLRMSTPFIAIRIFRNPGFTPNWLRAVAGAATASAAVYLVTQHLIQSRGDSPAAVGAALLPEAVGVVLGAVCSPRLAKRFGQAIVLTASVVLQAASLAWLSTDPSSILVPITGVGIGLGVLGTLAAAALFDAVTAEEAGHVGAIQEVGFALGNGLGVAVFGLLATSFDDGYPIAMIAAALTIAPLAHSRRRPRIAPVPERQRCG